MTDRGESLTGGITDIDKQIIGRVEELANKKGWKMSHVALAWNVHKGTLPIVGFSSVARIEEAATVRGKTLSDEEMKYLEELYQPKEIHGHM